MNIYSALCARCVLGLFIIFFSASTVFGQCDPAITSRLGGDVPHLTSIDSNRILIAKNRGLEIYNVSNAAAPVLTGRIEVGDAIGKMKLINGRAYVLTDTGLQQTIRVYTVTGAAPVYQTTIFLADQLDFDSRGTQLFVASHDPQGETTITAMDVTPVDFPLFLGSIVLPGPSAWFSSVTISISSTRAFVSYSLVSAARLTALNIANPAAMSVLGTHDEAGAQIFGPVTTSGNYAYVCHSTLLEIYSLTSFPSFPQVGSIFNISSNDVALLSSTLFVASSYGGVRPYNLATPTSPVPYAAADTIGTSNDIEIVGDRLYNADREGGVSILQVGNPASITQLGTISAPVPSRVQDIVDTGTTLYVLDELGVRIFSTASPDAPALLGSLTLPDTGFGLCSSRVMRIYNSHAYITGCNNHLLVVNVANPAAPFLRADVAGFNADYDIAFSGNDAYFCGQSGLKIVNISNPAAPVLASTYALAGVTISVETAGQYLYLGTRDNGLWILSLASPESPQLTGYAGGAFMGSCYGLALSGNTAFVGRGNGFEIIDIANPNAPFVQTTLLDVRATVGNSVNFRGGNLHVNGRVQNIYGIHRLDASSLTQPVVIGSLRSDFSGFTAINSRIYAGDIARADMIASSLQTQWKPAFRRHPANIVPCLHSYALFNVNVSAVPGATYRWNKDGAPLPIGGRYVGSDQANLTILNLARADVGNYTCTATNSCGTTTSNIGTLSFCFADFNCDEAVDFFDYLDFVDAFAAGSPNSDFNEDGAIDFFDYLDFVDALSQGC